MADSSGTRIFAGAAHTIARGHVTGKGGLFRRLAGAGDWESLQHGLPEQVEVRAVAIHPGDRNVIYAGTQGGPYRSTNGQSALGCRIVVNYSNSAGSVDIPLPDDWRVRGEDRLVAELAAQPRVRRAYFNYS